MDTPRLHSYPFDQEVVARIRARERARQSERLARRSSRRSQGGWRALLQWIAD